MEKLEIYNKVREVPEEAKKPINGGRLKGKTDINPMWRIKSLTETFGPCGFGWYTEVVRRWTETGANGEIAAFCDINLFVRSGEEWSKPISGTGGSMLVENETKGLFTSDECYKMAYTDAISVACKSLGFGADVYWEKDSTKYGKPEQLKAEPSQKVSTIHIDTLFTLCEKCSWSNTKLLANASKMCGCEISKVEDMTLQQFKMVADYLEDKVSKLESQN